MLSYPLAFASSVSRNFLIASTTYYYIVRAVDTAGNEGAASPEASGRTSEAPAQPAMHVTSIEMSTGSKTAGPNKFVWATASVTIVDANGNPVGVVTVYGHWQGATIDSDSGTTNNSGQVTLSSDSVKNPPSNTTFTFVVDNVVLSGWIYDSLANVETKDSITV
ncbi:MAG: hypothetical protein V1850_07400 [Candidatus Bathyarchaeota archaeon]